MGSSVLLNLEGGVELKKKNSGNFDVKGLEMLCRKIQVGGMGRFGGVLRYLIWVDSTIVDWG